MELGLRKSFKIVSAGSSLQRRVAYSLAIVRLILVPVILLAVYYLFRMGRSLLHAVCCARHHSQTTKGDLRFSWSFLHRSTNPGDHFHALRSSDHGQECWESGCSA